jgi:hypothetical protein
MAICKGLPFAAIVRLSYHENSSLPILIFDLLSNFCVGSGDLVPCLVAKISRLLSLVAFVRES